MTFDIEPTTWFIAACMLYHYATSVKSLVMMMVCTRYIVTKHAGSNALYHLAGAGRPARVPPRPPHVASLGHDVAGPSPALLASVMHYIRVVTRVKTAQQWDHTLACGGSCKLAHTRHKTRFCAIAKQNIIVSASRILN